MHLIKILMTFFILSSPAFAFAECSNHDHGVKETNSQDNAQDEAKTRKPSSEYDPMSVFQAGRPIFGNK